MALSDFIKILSLFNTQPNRPRESPAFSKHVGQVPYSMGFKFGKKANRPRASNAISKHVGQVPYSMGFKFGKKGPSKFCPILAYRSGAVGFHQNFKSFQHTT